MINTYVAMRRMSIAGRMRDYAELVPEAHLWRTAGNHVHVGKMKRVDVTEGAFLNAIRKFCPDQEQEITAELGFDVRPGVYPRADLLVGELQEVDPEPEPDPEPVKKTPKKAAKKKSGS